MAITGRVHFNVNCSGYAVGMPPYRVKGGLLVLAGASPPVGIDLLQWLEPHDTSAPYPHLYHCGIARVALATNDLDGDMAKLAEAGAEFLSKPARMPEGSGMRARFVCFEDPDGTVLELVET